MFLDEFPKLIFTGVELRAVVYDVFTELSETLVVGRVLVGSCAEHNGRRALRLLWAAWEANAAVTVILGTVWTAA